MPAERFIYALADWTVKPPHGKIMAILADHFRRHDAELLAILAAKGSATIEFRCVRAP
jgi:hypothetical protein